MKVYLLLQGQSLSRHSRSQHSRTVINYGTVSIARAAEQRVKQGGGVGGIHDAFRPIKEFQDANDASNYMHHPTFLCTTGLLSPCGVIKLGLYSLAEATPHTDL